MVENGAFGSGTSGTHAVMKVVAPDGQHLPDITVIESKSQIPAERLLTIEYICWVGVDQSVSNLITRHVSH